MPFDLKSASNNCVDVVSRILKPIRDFTAASVDMAVLSNDWTDHLSHLDQFLGKIKDTGLTLNFKKCNFGQFQVAFVGHVGGSGRIEPDPVKLETLKEMQPPVTKSDVMRLIGFLSYFRSFIPSFAEKSSVITDLTQIEWTNDGVEKPLAFASLKLSEARSRWATIEHEA
jgi:hypothetical protein